MTRYCEVCLSALEGPTLDFGFHPLADDLIPIGSSEVAVKYHQEIVLCGSCFTAQHLHQVNKETLFSKNYHYRAGLTKDVLDGMNDLVLKTISRLPTNKERYFVLDIGCNDGSLLGVFKEKITCTTVGIDPTDAILEHNGKIDLPIQDFFNLGLANDILENFGFPDIITFTNVFAHIEDFQGLLIALKSLIGPETLLVIENHYLGSILKDRQFDTFYHEHPRTYSVKSFVTIAELLEMGIEDIEFPSRYGGNIRVTLSKKVPEDSNPVNTPNEVDLLQEFIALQSEFESWVALTKETIETMLENGTIVGKSLPARAVMLISSLQLDSDKMPYVYEQPSSPKIGHYVPGTKIEIVSDSELCESEHKRLILWSWHISKEVTTYLEKLGFKGEIWVPLPRFTLSSIQ